MGGFRLFASLYASGLQLPESRIEGVADSSHRIDEPGQGIEPAFLIGNPDFIRVVE